MFIPHIKYPLLESCHSILHFTTTRSGGVSNGKYEALNLGEHVLDDPIAVAQNKELLKEAFALKNLIIPDQCHTANVKVVNDGSEVLTATDALVTNQKGICIGVLTADCVPVLLYDPNRQVVAAIHAGWRGLMQGALENTVELMRHQFETNPKDILATIGPCISKGNYEVGKEVWKQFEQKFSSAEASMVIAKKEAEKAFFDLRMAARIILAKLSVDRIETSEYCTFAAKHTFFSARREGIQSGRFLSAIMLR